MRSVFIFLPLMLWGCSSPSQKLFNKINTRVKQCTNSAYPHLFSTYALLETHTSNTTTLNKCNKQQNNIFNRQFGALINHEQANKFYISNFNKQWNASYLRYQKIIEIKVQKLQSLLKDLQNKYHLPILERAKAKHILESKMDLIEKLYLLDVIAKQIPIFLPERNCVLTSHFGYRKHPITGKNKFHHAIDIAGPKGCDVYASADGIVAAQGDSKGYGKYLELDHGYGLKTRYAHLSKYKVKSGQKVIRGEKIGIQGKSGLATNHHLHFEVILQSNKENKRINGYDFVYHYFK